MPVYFFRYEAAPKPSHPEVDQLGGAFINCWIEAKSLPDAKVVSLDAINANEWTVEEPEEAREVSSAYYRDNPEGLESFQQALRDGVVLEEYVFPKDGE